MSTSIDPNAVLDLSAGVYVKGIPVSDTAFLAVTRFGQLAGVTRDPRHFSDKQVLRGDTDLAEEAEIHDLVQRALTGSKKANVPKYAEYIAGIVNGTVDGVLPPIHGVSFDKLDVVAQGGHQYILVPSGKRLMTLDGETQLTAHYVVHGMSDPELKRLHADLPLAMMIHHGITLQTARQYFHDLNVLAVRPNTSLGLAMDSRDPLIKLVNDVAGDMGITDAVDQQARQLSKRSGKLVTFTALRQAVINVMIGMAGVQYGSRPVPLEGIDLGDVRAVASQWLKTYFDHFPAEIADRENTLAGSAPVLAAVGAMGKDILDTAPAHRDEKRAELLGKLTSVDWAKGEPWAGIAGKFGSRGKFSVGGTKEVAYAVYNVLTDPTNPGYQRVRGAVQSPAPIVIS